MATVIGPQVSFDRDESQRRVRHPLERLRSYIRLYVSAEGLRSWACTWLSGSGSACFWTSASSRRSASIGSRLSLGNCGQWCWLGWRRASWPWWPPGCSSACCAEFRPNALALLLEHRFPAELGDRLITAVEMADPRLAERVRLFATDDRSDRARRRGTGKPAGRRRSLRLSPPPSLCRGPGCRHRGDLPPSGICLLPGDADAGDWFYRRLWKRRDHLVRVQYPPGQHDLAP